MTLQYLIDENVNPIYPNQIASSLPTQVIVYIFTLLPSMFS